MATSSIFKQVTGDERLIVAMERAVRIAKESDMPKVLVEDIRGEDIRKLFRE